MSNYALADTKSQWYQDNYPGASMNLTAKTMVVVVHTTEGISWPGYSGGATAPNYTGFPPLEDHDGDWRAHFPDEKSARALENRDGGVETNTLNCVQIELIGTCDPKHKVSWIINGKTYLAGEDYVYWPDATDVQLRWLANILADFHERHGLQLLAPRTFKAYPGSYGLNNGVRLTGSQWLSAVGVFGHQHVPENAHGDPGEIDMPRVLILAKNPEEPPVVVDPEPPVVTPPTQKIALWGKPETWVIGAIGEDVTELGQRILVWSKALGLPNPYKVGPGEPFTQTDVDALSKIQLKWWPGASTTKGGDADGYPGLETFKRLLETPVKKVTVPCLHWNIAGSDKTNGFGAKNATRGDDVGRWAQRIGYEIFLACEAGQKDLLKGVNSVCGIPFAKRAKAIWNRLTIKLLKRTVYSDDTFAYLNTLKWGAAIMGEKEGIKFGILEVHTDYRKPAQQAKQLQSIFKKFRADCDALGIKHTNQVVCGDLNWDGSAGDDPFEALAKWNFEEKGNREIATFMTGKHLDGVLAHKEADVTVTRYSRANEKGVNLSDHYPLRFVLTLN